MGRAVEEAELDRALRVRAPEVVEVEGAVAVVVVVVGVGVVPPEPGLVDLLHRGGRHPANPLDESVVDLPRVPRDAVGERPRRLEDQLLLLVEGAHEVLDLGRREVRRAHVDVEPRAGVRLRAVVAKLAHHLLQGVEVARLEDRRDHLRAAVEASIAHHLPPASIGHRHHPVGKVRPLVPRRAARRVRHHLRGGRLADPLVLQLASEGAAHHLCLCYRHLFAFLFFALRRAFPSVFLKHMMP